MDTNLSELIRNYNDGPELRPNTAMKLCNVSIFFVNRRNCTQREVTALLGSHSYTECEGCVLRKCFGNVPSRDKLREACWSFLDNLPLIMILRGNAQSWEELSVGSTHMGSYVGRNILCARLSLVQILQS